MLALAILSLVASLVVSSISYGTRARAMEANYKRIQQISLRAENLTIVDSNDRHAAYESLLRDYEVAVDSSENHSAADYRHAVTQMSPNEPSASNWRDHIRHSIPYATFVVPIALLIPFAIWFTDGW